MSNAFITYADIAPMFPIQPAPERDTVLRWSRHGLFPKFFRPGNRKAEPLFDRQEVGSWMREAYAPFFALKQSDGRGRRGRNV
jgi:hypothetical protein